MTGSVTSGAVRVGEELEWLPSGRRVPVRALHNHDQPAEEVHRGMRAAINLAGVAHDAGHPGQELATPGFLKPARTLTVRLRASREARRPLKHRTPLRLHIGTAEVLATLSLLNDERARPGQWGLAQLFLDEPAMAVWGQPFVVRESSSATTLGGGRILQPNARKIRRRHLESIERAEKLIDGSALTRAATAAWFHGRRVSLRPISSAKPAFRQLKSMKSPRTFDSPAPFVELALGPQRTRLIPTDVVAALENRVVEVITNLHAEFPLLTMHDRKMVQSRLDYVGDEPLIHAVVDRLLERKVLIGDARRVASAEFKPKLSVNQRQADAAGHRCPSGGSVSAARAGQFRQSSGRKCGQSRRHF